MRAKRKKIQPNFRDTKRKIQTKSNQPKTHSQTKNTITSKDPELSGRTSQPVQCSTHSSSTVPDKGVLADFMMHIK